MSLANRLLRRFEDISSYYCKRIELIKDSAVKFILKELKGLYPGAMWKEVPRYRESTDYVMCQYTIKSDGSYPKVIVEFLDRDGDDGAKLEISAVANKDDKNYKKVMTDIPDKCMKYLLSKKLIKSYEKVLSYYLAELDKFGKVVDTVENRFGKRSDIPKDVATAFAKWALPLLNYGILHDFGAGVEKGTLYFALGSKGNKLDLYIDELKSTMKKLGYNITIEVPNKPGFGTNTRERLVYLRKMQ